MGEEEGERRGCKVRSRPPRRRRRAGGRKKGRWHNECKLVLVLGKEKLSAQGETCPGLVWWWWSRVLIGEKANVGKRR